MTTQQEDILFFAFRYALGRRTYVTSIVASEIEAQWDNISIGTKERIQKEIYNAIDKNRAGDICDIVEWNRILQKDV